MPRRPARPVSCWYSPDVSGRGLRAPELGEALDHHRAGRHVDPECQRLGGEHHLQQAGREALLDRLAEGRHQAGVVGGDARLEGRRPRPVAEGAEVVVGRAAPRPPRSAPADPAALLGRWSAGPRRGGTAGGVVTGGPAEDEGDGRQHAVGRPGTRPPRSGAAGPGGRCCGGCARRRSSRRHPLRVGRDRRVNSGRTVRPSRLPLGQR